MLSEAEFHRVIVEWNDTATMPAADGETIVDIVRRHAHRRPGAIAVISEREQLTYAELDARAERLAGHLRTLGVGVGDRVAVSFERRIEMVVAVLGVLKAGAAYVPIDPSYPDERVAFLLADAEVSAVVTGDRYAGRFTEHGVPIVNPDSEATSPPAEPTEPAPTAGPDDLAYIIYTSGSTGRPKGVMVEHRALRSFVNGAVEVYGLTPADRMLQFSPLSFDMSVIDIFVALWSGGCVALRHADMAGSIAEFAAGCETLGVTAATLPTAFFHNLAEAVSRGDVAVPTGLRVLAFGGDRCRPELVAAWRDHVGDRVRTLHVYGPTETTCLATFHELHAAAADMSVPIGRPLPNVRTYVLDADLRPVPVGETGELCIAGPAVARGYWRRPELIAGVFVDDPFVEGERMYRTGDLVRQFTDGAIDFIGRADQQVKIRGYRIELGEIESVLRTHPQVDDVVVVATDDSPRRLIAYTRTDAGAPVAGLREYVAWRLPEYMVPALFIPLSAFPLSVNGKIDRRALPAVEEAPTGDFVAPAPGVETVLAEAWAEALRLDRVGATDDYFELGGDSIASIRIATLAARHGLRITSRQVFERPTVRDLAQVAENAPGTITHTAATGEVALTPVQHWFFEQSMVDRDQLNTEVAFDVPAEPAAVRRALDMIISHHDALRMRYRATDGGWEQYVAETESAQVYTWRDLSALPASELPETMAAAVAEAHASLSLEHGPLMRAVHFGHFGTGLSRLLLVFHHIVVDGVSLRIVQDDLHALITGLTGGGTPELPARTTSYQEWSRRLGEYAASMEAIAELPYWRRLAGVAGRPLPQDLPDGSDERANGDAVTVSMSAELTRRLLVDVPRTYGSRINDAMIAALSAVLGDWCGGPVLVDLEGHGREDLFAEVDLSRTVGWFTSIFPIVVGADAGASPVARLERASQDMRGVPHHGVGYGILRYLADPAIRAELAAVPPAQVIFNYLGRFDRHAAIDSAVAVPTIAPSGTRPHMLEINGSVQDGRLYFEFAYSTTRHHRATVEAVAARFIAELAAIVEACADGAEAGRSPSDFSLLSLDQATIDAHFTDPGIVDVYPLSPIQQGMLFHTISESVDGVYVVQQIERHTAATPAGALDTDLLENAWRILAELHPIMRTSMRWEGLGEPVQVVHDTARIPFEVVDLTALAAEDRQVFMDDYRRADADRGFDLAEAPLLRITVFRLSDTEHRVMWTIHHIIGDAWSSEVLLQELTECYRALEARRDPVLPPAAPYRDFIAWLKKQNVEAAESFWRDHLDGFDEPTRLGAEATAGTAPKGVLGSIDADLTALAREFARRHGLTLNTVLQGAFAVLVAAHSRRDDVCFAVASSGRPPEIDGIDHMVGMLLATTPLRLRLDDEPVVDWLRRLQATQTEARQHEFLGLARIQALSPLGAGRELSDALLLFQNLPATDTAMFEHDVVWERTHFPLTVTVTPGTTLDVAVAYDPRRFQEHQVAGMIDQLRTLLRQITDSAPHRLGDLRMLSEPQERELLMDWNDTGTGFPVPEPTMTELIEQRVHAQPEAVAVIDGERHITYAELNADANRLAAHLRDQGVGEDTLVGVCFERSPEMVVAVLAVLKAGAGYVPIDPACPQDRLAFMLADTGAHIVVTHATLAPRLRGLAGQVVCLDTDTTDIARQSPLDVPAAVGPDGIAYVIYTSGSSGRPKGVVVEHHSLTNYAEAAATAYGITDEDRILQFMALSFDWSLDEIFVPLHRGAAIVLRTDAMAASVDEFLDGCHRLGVTVTNVPSAFWHLLAEAVTTGERTMPPSMRVVSIGGERANPDLVRAWQAAVPNLRLLNGYGPTETTCGATLCDLSATELGDGDAPIGRPLANVRVYVLDPARRPVPVGMTGELYIGGAGVARGYLNRPGLTAEVFLDDPTVPGGRMYRTGDLCRLLPDRQLHFVGRVDDQVKIRGYRVEPGEIETVVSRHPAVGQCAVVVHTVGIDDKRLVAHVACTGDEPSPAELSAFAAHRLPEYMIPKAFVFHESLPVNINGKLDRRALHYEEPATPQTDSAPEATDDSIESMLRVVWADVLGVPDVGPDDNFFDLGGDSILSIKLVSMCKRAGIRVTTRQLFANPTVREMSEVATLIEDRAPAAVGEPVSRRPLLDTDLLERLGAGRDGLIDAYPCSPVQLGMLFHKQYAPDSDAYVNQTVLVLSEDVDLEMLTSAWRSIVARHGVLRSSFVWNDAEEPVQLVHDTAALRVETISWPQDDLSAFLETDRERGFDLTSAPLMRLTIVETPGLPRRLVWTWHHMILDGWSGAIVANELTAAYQARKNGRTLTTPEPRPYRDYIAWLGEQDLTAAETFWRDELDGFIEPARWGTGEDPGGHRKLDWELSAGLAEELTVFARRHRLTPNTVIQGAFALLIAGYTGARDVCFGIASAGRSPDIAGVESMVGMFLATTPLRTTLDPDQTVLDMLADVQARQLAGRQHEHAPLTRIQSWSPLGPGQSLFDTVLAVQNYNEPRTEDQAAPDWTVQSSPGFNSFALTLHIRLGDRIRFGVEYDSECFTESGIRTMLKHYSRVLSDVMSEPGERLADMTLPRPLGSLPLRVGSQHEAAALAAAAPDRAPQSGTEAALAEIWAEVLGREHVGVHDNFFDLGGDSITAIRVVAALSARTGLSITPRAIFEHPTVSGLAEAIDTPGTEPTEEPAAAPLLETALLERLGVGQGGVTDAYPCSPVQLGMLFHSLYESGSDAYVNQTVLALSEDVDLDVLAAAWRTIVARHEALRSSFVWQDTEEPVQLVHETVDLPFEVVTAAASGLAAFLTADRERAFDFTAAPLMRLAVVEDPAGPRRLVWTWHHMVLDGWSSGIIAAELTTVYQALLAGRTPSLPAPRPYREYIAWLGRQDLTEAEAFWRNELEGFTEPARWGSTENPGRQQKVSRDLPAELTEELTAFARRHRITLNTMIQGAFALLVAGCSGARDVCFGVASAGRPPEIPGIEEMVGMFLATTPLRTVLDPDRTVLETLAELQVRQLDSRQHEHAPLTRIQGWSPLGSGRSLFDTVLIFGNQPDGSSPLFQPDEHGNGTTHLPLALWVMLGRELSFHFEYRPGMLDERTVRGFADHFTRLLRELIASPASALSELGLPPTLHSAADTSSLTDLPMRVESERAAVTTVTGADRESGSPTEALLAEVWAEVLGRERVGVHENFFDLGGDSIAAIRVVATVLSRAGRSITPREIFEHPTVCGLAAAMDVPADTPAEEAGEAKALLDAALLDRLGVGRDGVIDAYRCSPVQLGMLFHSLYESGSDAYVNQTVLALSEDVDLDVLAAAWRMVLARHDALRSSFVWNDTEEPVQLIHDTADLSIETVTAADGDLKALLEADRARGFDLTAPPLMRLTVVVVPGKPRHLVWTWHHMILDGWSGSIIADELSTAYQALASGDTPSLPVPRPYREYIAWLGEQDLTAAESFWRDELDGFTEPARWGSPDDPGENRKLVRRLPTELTEELTAFARRHRITLNTVIQGAFALLIAGRTGAGDVCLGVASAGRPPEIPGVESMVGMFLATTPLRAVLSPDRSVLEMLAELQVKQLTTRQYEHAPLTKIQGWSPLGSGRSLFDTLLVFSNQPDRPSPLFAPVPVSTDAYTNYPLTVTIVPGEQLTFLFEYQSTAFADDAIARLADSCTDILRHIRSEAMGAIADTPTMSKAEYDQVVVTWNERDAGLPVSDRTVVDLFELRAREQPDAPAVVFDGGRLSYAQLNARANRVAWHLRSLGVGPESRVGIYCDRSPQMLIAVLAVLKAGGAYVPLDPGHGHERAGYVLADAGVAIVLSAGSLVRSLEAPVTWVDLDDESVLATASDDDPPPAAGMDDLAYVIYTSGSTGQPKGVMIEHRALSSFVPASIAGYGITAADRVLQFMPLAFDWSVGEIFAALSCGAALVLRTDAMVESMAAFAAGCDRHQVTMVNLPARFWHTLTDTLADGDVDLPSTLQTVITGGDRVDPSRVRTWRRLFGNRLRLFTSYGPTETTCDVSVLEVTGLDPDGPEVPIGRPFPSTRAYVLDEWRRPLPVGVPGELHLGGAHLARGYLGRPDLTASAFIESPFRPGERLYQTGDRARFLPDGALEIVGRTDHQVKIRGYRVEPAEIEVALARHMGVGDCVVVAAGEPRVLVAYVVPREGVVFDPRALRTHLAGEVPEFMIPSVFVPLAELPQTDRGKLDRRALPAPDADVSRPRAVTPPSTPAEKILAEIWSDVLQIDSIGVDDDFFRLGGDSIVSIRIVARAAKHGLRITLRDVFEHPTIAGLAAVARESEATVPVERSAALVDATVLAKIRAIYDGGPSPVPTRSP